MPAVMQGIMIYSAEDKGCFGYMTSDDYMTILYINIATCIHAHTHARPQGPQSLGPLSGLHGQGSLYKKLQKNTSFGP